MKIHISLDDGVPIYLQIVNQIKYLVEGIGAKQTERQIDELIESQPRQEEE